MQSDSDMIEKIMPTTDVSPSLGKFPCLANPAIMRLHPALLGQGLFSTFVPCTKHQLTKAWKRGKNYASQKVWMHTCVMQCSTKSSRQYWELKLNIDTVPQKLPWETSFPKKIVFRMSNPYLPVGSRIPVNPIFCSASVTLRWRRSWHPQIASAVAIAQETFTLVVILHQHEGRFWGFPYWTNIWGGDFLGSLEIAMATMCWIMGFLIF